MDDVPREAQELELVVRQLEDLLDALPALLMVARVRLATARRRLEGGR